MSKRTITLIAGVGVLAVLLLAYLIMSAAGVGKTVVETTAEDPKLTVAAYNYKDVLTIGYTKGGEALDFTYNTNTGKWVCDKLPALPINLELPTYMASAISSIKAERFIEDTNANFAAYGLDKPYLSVRISYSDGVSREYHVGNYNSSTGTYYFNVGGTNEVYTIASGLLPYFEYSLLELVQPETLPTLYANTFTITSAKIGTKELNAEEIAEYKKTLAQVTLGSAVGWAENDAALAKFGLDKPTVVEIKYSEAQNVSDAEGTISSTVHVEGDVVLHIGLKSSDGKYWCKTDDSIVVYEVSEAVLAGTVK